MNRLSRVLTINLSNRSFKFEDRSDLFEKYIGGAGVAIKLLEDNCPEGAVKKLLDEGLAPDTQQPRGVFLR